MTSTVALITQPMRSTHCAVYLNSHETGPAIIVTSDPAAFADSGLRPGIRMIRVPLAAVPGSMPYKLVLTWRRRLLSWARGGSALGARLESIARATRDRIRQGRERPASDQPEVAVAHPSVGTVSRILAAVNEEDPIGRIVVFDLFDLPAALDFGLERGIEISVR